MLKILIKNGLVIDPAQGLEQVTDVYIVNGLIKEIGTDLNKEADKIIDATGKVVTPGFVEIHAHFREPGMEEREDILSGSMSAINGGYTTVCVMPNTVPVIDNEPMVTFIKAKARAANLAKIEAIGAVSKGQKGKELAEMAYMKRSGAVAFSDDGNAIHDSQLMRNALEYSNMLESIVISHPEDTSLYRNGTMNEGYISTKLGLPAIPKAAEEIMIARDIILAEVTKSRLHVAHVSTAAGTDLIRQAKARGVRVTAEVTPHHLVFTDQLVDETQFDTNTKMSPPLREAEDCQALLEGLLDGTIDAIATDHAPHHLDDKNVEYDYAAFGITGLETSFAALYTALVKTDKLSLNQLVAKLTIAPATVLNLDRGTLAVGKPADVTIIDCEQTWQVTPDTLQTKGKNTPWLNRELQGKVQTVLVNGIIKLAEGEFHV